MDDILKPNDVTDIRTTATGHLAFLLSCIRCGEKLSEAEEACTRQVIESLKADRNTTVEQSTEIQSLRSQLAASLKLQMDLAEENVRLRHGLEWQTGKPPKDGWYWVRMHTSDCNPRIYWIYCEQWCVDSMHQWSGPIPMPVEKEGE